MISIIIPAYNEEKQIEKTLSSLKSQNYKDYEIIVVCNGCTDKTGVISKKYTDKVVNLKQKNTVEARNYGAKLAKYNILLFLDADTYFTNRNMLRKIADKKITVATCLSLPNKTKTIHLLLHLLKNISTYFGRANGMLVCNKNIFKKVNGYNKEKFPIEHRDLIKRMKEYGRFKVIPSFVKTSMRRYEKLGYFNVIGFWLNKILLKKKLEYQNIR